MGPPTSLGMAAFLPLALAAGYYVTSYIMSPRYDQCLSSSLTSIISDFAGDRMIYSFALMGGIWLAQTAYKLYKQSVQPMVYFISTPPRDISALGKWVVLSDVIGNTTGEAFARHAAEAGSNLILLGRKSRKLDQFALDLDKLGYLGGARTKIETVSWYRNENGTDIDDAAFWAQVDEKVASATADDGLGLLVHCCSSDTKQSSWKGPPEGYSRRLIGAVLPQMAFRNQGAIVCVSTTDAYVDGDIYPDRNDLLDCAPACAAYTQQLIQSLHGKYRPLGIDCLSVFLCASWSDPQTCLPKGTFARLVLRYLRPSAETIVEASLKALGRQAELTPSESLFAQSCRYSMGYEEKI
mmetsp:Transcript_28214/g.81604  ORF Transcript_28214/g.81604 Transcript_28214/m.81604 type:complete len:353 (-) Transcript_28214:109-1167(-)